MIRSKFKESLIRSVVLLVFVIYECDTADVTLRPTPVLPGPKLDSPSVGFLWQGVGLQNLTNNMADIKPMSTFFSESRSLKPIEKTNATTPAVDRPRPTVIEDTDNHPSEIKDLFSVGIRLGLQESKKNESVDSSSRLITLEGGSSAKTSQIKTDVPEIFKNLNDSGKAIPNRFLSSSNQLNGTLIVPSEGGVLQQQASPTLEVSGSRTNSETSTSGKLESKLSTDKTKVRLEVPLGLPSREGILSLASNVLDSPDLAVGTRKNGNVSHHISVDLSSNKTNSNTSVTINVNTNAGKPGDIVKHDNISEVSRPISTLQNGKINVTEETTKSISSLPNVSLNSSNTLEEVTLKIQSTSDTEITKINSSSNKSATIDIKNFTAELNLVDESGIIASYPSLKKRLKPLKTTDSNSFQGSSIVQERTSSEHDYVIPIVVTILTVPMLVVLALFLYKKGSDCWERRHYRRMDFLIDGMYND